MVKNQDNFFFFTDLLSDIFEISKQDFPIADKIKSKTVPISEDVLNRHYNWVHLLGRSIYYKEIYKQYQDKLGTWEQEYKALIESVENKDISFYIDNYVQSPFRKAQIEKGIISFNQLKEKLLRIKPKIFHFYKAEYFGFQNFIIFETRYFHLSLHLKLTQKLTKTFESLVIYSMWFEAPESLSSLNIEWINGIYQGLLLGNDLSQFLENNFYSNEILFDFENFNPQNYSERGIINSWARKKPLMFVTHIKILLNANPVNFFQNLAHEISQITEICISFSKSEIQSPQQYYKHLNSELEDFLKRGKNLFQKAKKAQKFISNKVSEDIEDRDLTFMKMIQKKSSLTPEILYSLFQLAYEYDKNDSRISLDNRGFRSLNEIYTKFGIDYNFSKQTVYNCFNNSDLEIRLESRDKVGKGGGTQYRIRRMILAREIKEEEYDQVYMEELMDIEEALIYFNQEDYEKSLSILKDTLRIPSKLLKGSNQYFLGSMFYLGKIYFQKQDYLNAQEYFEKILKINNQFFDIRYYLMLCYFNNNKKILLQDLNEDNIIEVSQIFAKNEITYEEHKDLIIGKFTPDIKGARKFFKKQSNELDLKNFVIHINSTEIENRIRFHYGKDENEIISLNQNIFAYETLRKTLAQSIIIKIELIRQEIFENILFNNKGKILDLLNNFFAVVKEETTIKTFPQNYFHGYILYFRYQLEYYPIEFNINDYKEIVKNIYPKFYFEKVRVEYNYPIELEHILRFLNTINGIYETLEWRKSKQPDFLSEPSLSIKPLTFVIPVHNLEYILTKYLIIKSSNVLKKHLKEIANEFKKVKMGVNLELRELMDFWFEFRLPYSKYAYINSLQKTIHKAVYLIITHDLSVIKTKFEDIQKEVDDFALKINIIREKGTKFTVNKIFEILQANYHPKKSKEQIDISTTFVEYNENDVLHSQLINILDNFLEDINGIKILHMNFNDTVMKNEGKRIILRLLKSFRKELFRLKLLKDSSDKAIELTYEAILDLGDHFSLIDNLEVIFDYLISVLEANYNQLIIKSKKFADIKFKKDIIEILKIDLKNDYFLFKFEDLDVNDIILIRIEKK